MIMRIFWKSSLVVVTNVIVEWIKPETPTGVSGSFFFMFLFEFVTGNLKNFQCDGGTGFGVGKSIVVV